MTTTISDMTARTEAAIAAGQRLHIGVSLSYVGGGSDKFWNAAWMGGLIAVNFGRHDTIGQFQLHDLPNETAAAAKMWALLREKTGKGYTVVDSAVLVITPARDYARTARHMLTEWVSYRDARALNPKRPLDHPELLGTSLRSRREGGQVLLDVTSASAPQETLLAAAVADPSERFLPPLVMSRPDVPEEAKFLAALAGTAKVVL